MLKLFIIYIYITALIVSSWPLDDGIPKSFDCAMRKAAYDYGKHLLPRKKNFEELYYALYLNDPECLVPLNNDNNKEEDNHLIKKLSLDNNYNKEQDNHLIKKNHY